MLALRAPGTKKLGAWAWLEGRGGMGGAEPPEGWYAVLLDRLQQTFCFNAMSAHCLPIRNWMQNTGFSHLKLPVRNIKLRKTDSR